MDPRLRTIRFWLIAVLGVVLFATGCDMAILAAYSVSPFGLMIPAFSASVTTCPGICSSNPATQYQIVTSGFSNGSVCTDCADRNATWTVTGEVCTNWHSSNRGNSCYCASFAINPCLCTNNPGGLGGHDGNTATREITLQLFDDGGTGTYVGVTFFSNNFFSSASDCHTRGTDFAMNIDYSWRYTITPTEDCGHYSSLHVPKLTKGSLDCNDTSDDAIVTAL